MLQSAEEAKAGVIPFFATKSVVKVDQKGKSWLKLLEPKKVPPNAKSCSNVAKHNRDMPGRASPLTSKIG
jgi:hypothetical protein